MRKVRGKATEEIVNQALANALKQTTARWNTDGEESLLVERTGLLEGAGNQGKHPDILIATKSMPPVVVETSFDGNDADKDARERLGATTKRDGLKIDTAISIKNPEAFRTMTEEAITKHLLDGYTIHFATHWKDDEDLSRFPSSGFLTGTVFDLARLVSTAAPSQKTTDSVAESVSDRVKQAAQRLEDVLSTTHRDEIAKLIYQRTSLKALEVTMVLWLNALHTQQRLCQQGVNNVPPIGFAPSPTDTIKVWKQILEWNWRSIFEPAVEVLERTAIITPGDTAFSLKLLAEAVLRIEEARLGEQINIGAELFPKLSEDRKEAAAFYTNPWTAELLAGLTIRWNDHPNDWKSADLFTQRQLADLTCGTGTLLRAGYRRILTFHEQAEGSLESIGKLHRTAMESGLVGTDVSPIAAHLTASSLAAIGRGEPYGKTQIGWVRVGGRSGLTGALEFFRSEDIKDLFADVAGASAGDADSTKASSISVSNGSLRWILMNPPYSRTRGGQSAFDIAGLTEKERKKCQEEWGKLVREEPADKRAGMAASFLALALKKVQHEGRVGFVLPLTAAFADSWKKTRRMVERKLTDITVVAVAAGQAAGQDALSADTGMEEMLLIASRRNYRDENLYKSPSPIRCVTLRKAPTRIAEAGETARAILEATGRMLDDSSSMPFHAGNDELGQVTMLHTSGEGKPWGPVGTLHSDLARVAENLSKGILISIDGNTSIPLPVEMTTIDKLFRVGPTHHRIGHLQGNEPIGAFELHEVVDARDATGSDRALWKADNQTQRRLKILPTHKGVAPTGIGTDHLRSRMRSFKSILFYARNMRWTSQALLAATTPDPVMGGRAWTSLSHQDVQVQKAFTLWSNSTLGMIVHWTQGQRTQVGRSTVQINALKAIPCPRLDQLPDAALDEAAENFNRLSARELRPACQAHIDLTRSEIDEAVIRMLGLGSAAAEEVRKLCQLWCGEPSVHGENKEALRLLAEKKP